MTNFKLIKEIEFVIRRIYIKYSSIGYIMDKLYQSLKKINLAHKLFQNPEGGSTLSDRDQSEK